MEQILEKLKKPFPEEILEKKEGPAKFNKQTKRWDKQWFSYIPVAHLQERLDAVLPLQWQWNVLDSHYVTVTKEKYIKEEGEEKGKREPVEEQHVIVLGRLTLNLPDGRLITKDAYGGSEMTKGTAPGDPHKGAASNAFRKAAMLAGLGSYLALNESTDLVEPSPNKGSNALAAKNPFKKQVPLEETNPVKSFAVPVKGFSPAKKTATKFSANNNNNNPLRG